MRILAPQTASCGRVNAKTYRSYGSCDTYGYGWYSNKMRGVRHRGLAPDLVARRPGLSPPPPAESVLQALAGPDSARLAC
jgi:hypothetical protein